MPRITVTPNTNITNPSDDNNTQCDNNEHHNDIVTDVIIDTCSTMNDPPSTSTLPSDNMGTVYFDGLRRSV